MLLTILFVNDEWKFSDFGLSMMKSWKTPTGSVRGTPTYMAPEQINPRFGPSNKVTDLWQMGIILYRMVTGKTPYASADNFAIMTAVCDCGPDLSCVPDKWLPVFEMAFQKDPSRRFQSADEFADEVESVHSGKYNVVFIYTDNGTVNVRSMTFVGPIKISTGKDHENLRVTTTSPNAEDALFHWNNGFSHSTPIQIRPVAGAGYEVICSSNQVSINGKGLASNSVQMKPGSVLMIGTSMAMKFEGSRPAMFSGSISPVGVPVHGVDEREIYRPSGVGIRFLNGLNDRNMQAYRNARVVMSEPEEGEDWEYVNKKLMEMIGIRARRYRELERELEEGLL